MDSIVSSLKSSKMERGQPTRNLALELARVTEAAALASGRFMGRGDKEGADGAAVNAMRLVLQTVDINGIIVIGEGEKDKLPCSTTARWLATAPLQTWMSPWIPLTVLVRWHSAEPIRWPPSPSLPVAPCSTPARSCT